MEGDPDMPTALDVAKYLIHLATPRDGEDTDALGPMRLQKLLYYLQGWHLAAHGRRIFSDDIEAWKHGPVVREVYAHFKNCGLAIPHTEGAIPESLSDDSKAFIESIWNRMKGFSATALRDMTHRESPWLEARGNLPPEANCNDVIGAESMRSFFVPKYAELLKHKDSRIDVAMWVSSVNAIQAGRSRTAGDLRREFRNRHFGPDRRPHPIVDASN